MHYVTLIKAFSRAAVCYLQPIPFQRKKFFSRLLRNTAFAVLAQQALHAGLGNLLYPNIEEKYFELGVPKDVVDTMALPPFAFVRPAPQDWTWADHLYALTDTPTLFGLVLSHPHLSQETYGRALPYPVCDISLPHSEGYTKSRIAHASLLPVDKIREPLSDDDALALTLAHEIGHCDWKEYLTAFVPDFYEAVQDGTLSTLMEREIRRAEFHSDLSAVELARKMDDPVKTNAMLDFLIATRASFQYYIWSTDAGYAYDFGASLDAFRNEDEIYTLAEFQDSRKELADYVSQNFTYQSLDDYAENLVNTLQDFIEESKDTAMPLSTRRAELFVQAIYYFAPDLATDTVVAQAQIEPSPVPVP